MCAHIIATIASISHRDNQSIAKGFQIFLLQIMLAWMMVMMSPFHGGAPTSRIVLDIGCGQGLSMLPFCAQPSWSGIIGLDTNAKALSSASRIVGTDPRVCLVHASLGEFSRECPPGLLDYVRLHYCFSDRSFPHYDDVIHDVHRLLKPEGLVDVEDYSSQFLHAELADNPSIHPFFDWPLLEKEFSYSFSSQEKMYPTLSSRRMIFRKRFSYM